MKKPVRTRLAYTWANAEGDVDLMTMATHAHLVREWVRDLYGIPWESARKNGWRVVKVKITSA